MAGKGIVNIRGKEYRTVALRVKEFREAYSAAGYTPYITTEMISLTDEYVVIKAFVGYYANDELPITRLLGTGYAHEEFGSSNALAAAGYAGDEYCSADELVNALTKQNEQKTTEDTVVLQQEMADPRTEYDEVSESWDERDIIEMINQERMRGVKLVGEEDYREWYSNTLRNRWNVDGLSDLKKLGKDKLIFFLKVQREFNRMKGEK